MACLYGGILAFCLVLPLITLLPWSHHGHHLTIMKTNLIIVPYTCIDSLCSFQKQDIKQLVITLPTAPITTVASEHP